MKTLRALLALCSFVSIIVFSGAPIPARAQPAWHPGHYMLVFRNDGRDADILSGRINELASLPNIKGIKVLWYWRDIENDAGGTYDWTAIEAALNHCAALGKQLVVGIDDRAFSGGGTDANARLKLPHYLIDNPIYGGGWYPIIGNPPKGVAAKIYLTAVADRYIAMMKAMAQHFNGLANLAYLEAVYAGVGESAVATVPADPSYSDAAFVAQRARIGSEMVPMWPNTTVIQPFNFIPGRASVYPAFMQHIEANRLAIGGPDIFSKGGTLLDDLTTGQETFVGIGGVDYRGKVPAMFDVQWPDFTAKYGAPLPASIFKVAYETLRCSHIFWIRMTGGTAAQNWSTGIVPFINSIHGRIHSDKPLNYGGGLPKVVECEAFDVAATNPTTDLVERRLTQADVLFHATGVGGSITFIVPYLAAGAYNITATVEKGSKRGRFVLESSDTLAGTYGQHGGELDTYADFSQGGQLLTVANGVRFTSGGTRYFRIRITSKNPASSGYLLALDKLTFTATSLRK